MAFSINSLSVAVFARREFADSQSAISGAVERLSSGLRINRAADDAAGLGISEEIKTQIKGLNQGARNANDLISMVQTADSSVSQVTDMLRRMRELATQARNGSLSLDQKKAISAEISELRAGINQVAEQTVFNTKSLLKNSLESQGLLSTSGRTALQLGSELAPGLKVSGLDVSSANEGSYSVSFGSARAIEGQRSRVTTAIDGTLDLDDTQAITIADSGAASSSITLSGTYKAGDAIRFTVKGDNPDRTLVQTYVVTAENLTENNDGLSTRVAGDSLTALTNIAAGMAAQYNLANALPAGTDVDLDNKFSKPDAVASGATVTFSGSYNGSALEAVTVGGYVVNRPNVSREIIPTQADIAAGNRITVTVNNLAYEYIVGSDETTETAAEGIRSLLARDYPHHATRAGSIVTINSAADLGLAEISYQVRQADSTDTVQSISSHVSNPGASPTSSRTITIADNDVIAGRVFSLEVGNPGYLRTYSVTAGTSDTAATVAQKLATRLDDHYGSGASAVSVSGGTVTLGSATVTGMANLVLRVTETRAGDLNPTVGPALGITSAVWGVGGRLDDGQYEFFYNDSGSWEVVQDPVAGFTSTFNGSVLTTSPGNQVNVVLSGTPKAGDRIFFDINNGDPERPVVRLATGTSASNTTSGISNDTKAVYVSGSVGSDTYNLQYNGSIWTPVSLSGSTWVANSAATYIGTYDAANDRITVIDNPNRSLSRTSFGNNYTYDDDRITFTAYSSGSVGSATLTRSVGVTFSSSSYVGGSGAVTGGYYTLSFNGSSWSSSSGSFNGSTLFTNAGGDVNIGLSGAKEGDSIQVYVDSSTGTASYYSRWNSYQSGVSAAIGGSDPLVAGTYIFEQSGSGGTTWNLISGPSGATYNGSTIINGPLGSSRSTAVIGVRQTNGTSQRDALSNDVLSFSGTASGSTFTYERIGVTSTTFAVAGGLDVGDYVLEYNGSTTASNYTIKNRFGDAVTSATYSSGWLTLDSGDQVELVLSGTPQVGDKVYFTITGGNVITNRLIEGSNIGGRETSVSSQTRDRTDRVISIATSDIQVGRSVEISVRGKEYAVLVGADDTASTVATKLASLLAVDYPNTTAQNETTDLPAATRVSVSGAQITLQEPAKLGLDQIDVSVREISNPGLITLTANSDAGTPGKSQTIALGEVAAGGGKTYNFDQLGIQLTLENQRNTQIDESLFAAYSPRASTIQVDSLNRSPMAQLGASARNGSDQNLTGFGDIRLAGSNKNSGLVAQRFDQLAGVLDELETNTQAALSDENFAKVIDFSDLVLDEVAGFQTQLGVAQNRLEHAISSIQNNSFNLQASRAALVEADYGSEMSKLIRMQIGQQAATAMMAQANLLPEVILSLLQTQSA